MVTRQHLFESLIFSTLTLLTLHYLLPKLPRTGWIGIPDDNPVQLQHQETKRWWLRKTKAFKAIFTTPYWSKIFPKHISTFFALGIYLIIYSSIALFYIQKSYALSYIYWYISIMAIGTIITLYPALRSYTQYGNKLLHLLWPIILWYSLFVMGILFSKLSYFTPIVFTLLIVNIGISSLLLPIPVGIGMLGMALCIYPWVPSYTICLLCNKEIITIEMVLGITILLCCLSYRFMRNKTILKCSIMELEKEYEKKLALECIHNRANWNRLDPTYSGKILEEIANNIETTDPEEQKQKLHSFSRILLQRAKEERTLTLEPKALKQVDLNQIILKAYETVRNLDKPLQLLLEYETKDSHLLTDPRLFERLLTINFFEICRSKQLNDYILTLSIRNTSLHYNCVPYIQNTLNKDKLPIPLTLQALAFCITTATAKYNVLPRYDVTNETIAGYIPKHISNLFQIESRQIVQAHGGYTAITETEEELTCLYVLPIDGRKVMHLKRYHTDDLCSDVLETVSSLAQEEKLIELLAQEIILQEKKIKETIAFIKQVHGTTLRQSGEPYYTHPMEVAKIVLEISKDPTTLLAALLHDTVEDSEVTLDQIELLYDREIAHLVDRVTHYNVHGFRWKLEGRENNRLLNKCKDIRVFHIKLADRLHNLRTLSVRTPADQVRIAKEILAFYLPWAKQNNFLTWIAELEAIAKGVLAAYNH